MDKRLRLVNVDGADVNKHACLAMAEHDSKWYNEVSLGKEGRGLDLLLRVLGSVSSNISTQQHPAKNY